MLTRRDVLSFPLLKSASPVGERPTAGEKYRFHHDNVLGTSMDVIISASSRQAAAAAETTLLNEIERLRKALSTYDPASEISRLNASAGLFHCSTDLFRVLACYDRWNRGTSGAISMLLGNAVRNLNRAGLADRLPVPDPPERQDEGIRLYGDRSVMRSGRATLNIDALGKAYVMDRAIFLARRSPEGISGILLNIGGDLVISGSEPQRIAIANPADPYENSAPLGSVALTNGAIATSGGYERGIRIGGQFYSHIIDPRTGLPANGPSSATVIARDSITANALATALCILTPEEGLRLAAHTPDTECLFVTRDGRQFRSAGFSNYEPARLIRTASSGGWPQGYGLVVTLTLKIPDRRPKRRPYVAVFVEDSRGRCVRTIALWTSLRNRWLPDLHAWYAATQHPEADSVSRATRPPGRYRLFWDGLDESGRPVPAGSYKITVETNAQDGDYTRQSGSVQCGGTNSTAITLKETSEFEAVNIEYGRQGDKL
jgi:FAD:protein FMN transferase